MVLTARPMARHRPKTRAQTSLRDITGSAVETSCRTCSGRNSPHPCHHSVPRMGDRPGTIARSSARSSACCGRGRCGVTFLSASDRGRPSGAAAEGCAVDATTYRDITTNTAPNDGGNYDRAVTDLR